MVKSEWAFVVVCALVVLAMIGPVNLAAGVVGALLVGLGMWWLLAVLAGPDITERRR